MWRAFQEIAVDASTAVGWPPSRYIDERTAFIVRSMTVRHAREAYYGEPLHGRTWITRIRREMFTTREVRIDSLEHGPLAAARQEWVHVSDQLVPTRAGASLLASFPAETCELDPLLPELPPLAHATPESPTHTFEFDAWWTWMDPLDHANHPAYVDWCDEALCRVLAVKGVAPVALRPVAEEVTFRAGVTGGQRVRIETKLEGHADEGSAIFSHRIFVGETLATTATTVRRLHGESGPSALLALFG